jgi:eukaryotic-like serine/threonine-protein kinase
VGLLSRDADFSIKDFVVYVGSPNVMVNCLAVPDAFLAHKNYGTALSEYRRIGYSFPGRAEGREAMFRAGITLLEQARQESANPHANQLENQQLYELALEEFEKLHKTPGAPLEYLGKALVYQALNENEEEVKCFELAFRRYPKHPLLPILHEQIVYRMHSSSRFNRLATYRFILLLVTYMPQHAKEITTKKLLTSLKKHWEPLFFIQPEPSDEDFTPLNHLQIGIILSFWLAKPFGLADLIDTLIPLFPTSEILLGNAVYCLLELGSRQLALKKILDIQDAIGLDKKVSELEVLQLLLINEGQDPAGVLRTILSLVPEPNPFNIQRACLYLMRHSIEQRHPEKVHELYSILQETSPEIPPGTHLFIDCYRIWAYLFEKNWEVAGEILQSYPLEELLHDHSLLHFLYGCWLYVTEGEEIASIHFSGVLETTHPRTWSLFSQFYNGRIDEKQGWIQKAFLWERRQLYLQLALFYECVGQTTKSLYYQYLGKKEYLDDSI